MVGVDEPVAPTWADYFWIAQQPFLWLGLFSVGLARAAFEHDSIAHRYADRDVGGGRAFVERALLGRLLSYEQFSPAARARGHLLPGFRHSAPVLRANLDRQRARVGPVWRGPRSWVLGGVICLIAADSLGSFFFFSRQPGNSFYVDLLQGLSYPLIGVGALVHARFASPDDAVALQDFGSGTPRSRIRSRGIAHRHGLGAPRWAGGIARRCCGCPTWRLWAFRAF